MPSATNFSHFLLTFSAVAIVLLQTELDTVGLLPAGKRSLEANVPIANAGQVVW
jgi:hypothetical protein